ncbi:glycosyltransferase [uncultured Vibrio sp.]|uniref:rhamnosyltransferase WsaF family glycosyltransferase n=1 Tax=uncultured Vibrio sp. TaxID=114054 RepID=UPI002638EE14|nr:glycosyltransferase [uncultured Vibrio sp.]
MESVVWFVPDILKGSGGHRTILAHAKFMECKGYKVTIHLEWDSERRGNESLSAMIERLYNYKFENVSKGWHSNPVADIYFATIWYSADIVSKIKGNSKKFYFVQDHEACFNPMGDAYILAEDSYRKGLNHITIGKWLTHKINSEFSGKSTYFDFGADLNKYNNLSSFNRDEQTVCFVHQPEKPRRCSDIGLKALAIVKRNRPSVKVKIYGSSSKSHIHFDHENLGLLSIQECSELYQKSTVGLCISASNPSRVPFEMMACGLPVVDIFRENNLYDYNNDIILLSEPSPLALASAIINLLDNEALRKSMSDKSIYFMSLKDESVENEQFLERVKSFSSSRVNATYTSKAYRCSNAIEDYLHIESESEASPPIKYRKLKRILPRPIFRALRSIYYKVS